MLSASRNPAGGEATLIASPPKRSTGFSRHLVYTSAGDYSSLDHWLRASRPFDVWISYYGQHRNRFAGRSEYYVERRGGKFPSLAEDYRRHSDIFQRYDAIFVMDDDVLISRSGISRLFAIREELDLWVLQPSFSPLGMISHEITVTDPDTRVRFANFVEVTCPLFRRDKLEAFLATYEPSVIGWGVDWWFCEVLGGADDRRIAIVDEVSCVNPLTEHKGISEREIDRLQPLADRIRAWETAKAKHRLAGESAGYRLIGSIPRTAWGKRVAAFRLWIERSTKVRRLWKRIGPLRDR